MYRISNNLGRSVLVEGMNLQPKSHIDIDGPLSMHTRRLERNRFITIVESADQPTEEVVEEVPVEEATPVEETPVVEVRTGRRSKSKKVSE